MVLEAGTDIRFCVVVTDGVETPSLTSDHNALSFLSLWSNPSSSLRDLALRKQNQLFGKVVIARSISFHIMLLPLPFER